jgi:membrane protein DedA with SNARE-associated domain
MDMETIQHLVTTYGPFAVGLGSTLDNTGVPIFFVVGMGMAHALGLSPKLLLVAAILGSVLGDLGTYAIGRYVLTKDRLMQNPIGHGFKPVLDAGAQAMKRWGSLVIVFGRFVPYLGKVTPLLAGSYGMGWPITVVSVTVGTFLLMGGFYLYADSAFQVVSGDASVVKTVSLAIGTAILFGLYCLNVRLRKRSRADVDL